MKRPSRAKLLKKVSNLKYHLAQERVELEELRRQKAKFERVLNVIQVEATERLGVDAIRITSTVSLLMMHKVASREEIFEEISRSHLKALLEAVRKRTLVGGPY